MFLSIHPVVPPAIFKMVIASWCVYLSPLRQSTHFNQRWFWYGHQLRWRGFCSLTCLSLCLVPSPDFSFHADEFLEVYVSASEHPNHFWIQIIGSRSLQLDKLVSEMTQHYDNSLVSCHRDRAGFDEKGAYLFSFWYVLFFSWEAATCLFFLLVLPAYLFLSLPILTLPILISPPRAAWRLDCARGRHRSSTFTYKWFLVSSSGPWHLG